MPQPTPNDLNAAVSALEQTKSEHREILDRIAGDEGMSGETRRALVAHVLEEEDEHMAEIQGLMRQPSSAPQSAPSTAQTRNLTVGSMRNDPASGQGPGSVGSLRRP
ncbi:MAG: hypothetical protein RL885_11635 [Planctomycetota bacterium]